MARLGRGWIIDAIRGGSGAEYVNHSCAPNLWARKTEWHIFLMSRRRIEKGEELTLDYRVRPKRPKFACHCGSVTCRGFMNLP
jgi:SET domain-containing protein